MLLFAKFNFMESLHKKKLVLGAKDYYSRTFIQLFIIKGHLRGRPLQDHKVSVYQPMCESVDRCVQLAP